MVSTSDDGSLLFRLHAPSARSVEIVGTFTRWSASPIAMRPTGQGWWFARVTPPPGDHEFYYSLDGRRCLADYAAGGVRLARYGRWMSLLHVPARAGAEVEPKPGTAALA